MHLQNSKVFTPIVQLLIYQENMIPFFSDEKKVAIPSVSRDDSYIIPSNIAV